jgi:hypothetical protein
MIISGAACTALVWIQTGIPFYLRNCLNRRRLKPLDCEMCMAFWLAILSSIYFEKNVLETIYIGGMAAVLAVFINKKLNA